MTRILVIDDDTDIRQVITYTLADEGYEIDEAADGESALEIIAERHPDVIILDMKMPGTDGWEFAKRYHERYNHQAPIIVLTAARDAGTHALEINAESFMAKPFDLDLLVQRLLSVLHKASNR